MLLIHVSNKSDSQKSRKTYNNISRKGLPAYAIARNSICLAVVVSLLSMSVCHAVVTQEDISVANYLMQELQNERQEMQDYVNNIDSKKGDLKTYIDNLDGKVTSISTKLDKNSQRIDELNAEIENLDLSISSTEVDVDQKYDIMKSRIRYIYESGEGGYLDVLLGSKNLFELLNRIEYINKISQYDRDMLETYTQKKDELTRQMEQKENDLAELEATQVNYEYEKQSLEQLTSDKQDELKKYEKEQGDSELILAKKDKELAAAQEELEKMFAEQRSQQAQADQQAGDTGSQEAGATVVPGASGEQGQAGDYSETSYSLNISGEEFIWPSPVAGRISCGFGPRKAPTAGASTYHKGVDIAVPSGTTVVASKAGKVTIAQYSSSAGNYVAIYHGQGEYTYYMHNSALCVSVGQEVAQGQKIALSGSTGISTGPHIHFAVCINGEYKDPLNYVTQP